LTLDQYFEVQKIPATVLDSVADKSVEEPNRKCLQENLPVIEGAREMGEKWPVQTKASGAIYVSRSSWTTWPLGTITIKLGCAVTAMDSLSTAFCQERLRVGQLFDHTGFGSVILNCVAVI
jgi:hypothetical protein